MTLLALCGCDQVLGIEGGTESPWFCNANVTVPSGKNSYEFHFVDDMLHPTSPTVLRCEKSDPTCAKSKPLLVNNGTARFALAASNDGYLEIPVSFGWPTLVELGPPGNVVPTKRTFPVFNLADITVLEGMFHVNQDSANGAILVAAYDCNEMPAEGVSIAVSIQDHPVEFTPLYFTYSLMPITSDVSTSSTWLGLASNIPATDAGTVTLTRKSDKVVVATAPVHVRASTFTVLYLGPTKTE